MIQSVTKIQTLNLLQLEPYRTLKRPLEHLNKGIFVSEGEKVTTRLLASGIRVYSLLLSEDWFEKYETIITAHKDLIDIYIGEKKLLETIVGYNLHQSIMAIAKIPKRLSVEDIVNSNLQKNHLLYVLLDGIVNAENMGVIIRNCVCFGVDGVIVLPNSCDPYLRRSVRNSMGNIFQIPIVYLSDAMTQSYSITILKQNGIKFYAAHPNEGSKDIRTIQFAEKSCIVLGAEGPGISQEVLQLCDEYVTIPMKEGVDSLNVASASAVMLWEASKAIMNDKLGMMN